MPQERHQPHTECARAVPEAALWRTPQRVGDDGCGIHIGLHGHAELTALDELLQLRVDGCVDGVRGEARRWHIVKKLGADDTRYESDDFHVEREHFEAQCVADAEDCCFAGVVDASMVS
jgi:hypothetical protein